MVMRQLENDKRAGEVADPQASQPSGDITEREVEDIEERSSPRNPVIYEIVRRLGEEEMARPALSLWWSAWPLDFPSAFRCWRNRFCRRICPMSRGGRS